MTDRIQATRDAVASIEQYNLRRDVDPSDYIHLRLDHISELLKAHDEAVRRADEAERLAAEHEQVAIKACNAAAEMQERCAWACEAVASAHALVRNTTAEQQCAAAIRSLSSTTGATNKD